MRQKEQFSDAEVLQIIDQIMGAYITILLCGCGPWISASDNLDASKMALKWCNQLLRHIVKKHIMDGFSVEDKRKLLVEVLQTATDIANEKIKPGDPIPRS